MNAATQPETQAIVKASTDTLAIAKAIKITTVAEYQDAAGKLQAIKGLSKQIDDTFDPHIKRAHDAHKELVGEKKKHQLPLIEAECIIKRAVLGFQQDQERIRREAEAKAQEAARKERQALEAKARAAEQKAAEEAAAKRRAAQEAEAAGNAAAAAKLRAQADSKEAAGANKAEALQTQAACVVAPVLASNTPKVSGISSRITYRAEVIDLSALVAAVGCGTAPLNCLQADMTVLNGLARTLKESLNYPGVSVKKDEGISSRSM